MSTIAEKTGERPVGFGVHTIECDEGVDPDGTIGCSLSGEGKHRGFEVDEIEVNGHITSNSHTLPGRMRVEYEFHPADTAHCRLEERGDDLKLKCENTTKF